ncbi:MAG: O-antigen ligase family protein [Sutterellaceae bacterium]|nr:O-antigen ligase family protein [Burkholderiaceae bacterium]MDW8429337.1 O-antigen ligase family protein [Sutterellaceae bacterium]
MLTALAFLVGFFTLLGLALVRHPIFGLYAYLATFYIHPPSRWWAQNLPDLRWALLSGAITLLAIFIHRQRLQQARTAWYASTPGVLLIAFVAWLWLQSLWALDAEAHVEATVQFTKYLVAFYLIHRLAETPDRVRDILLVHVAGCTYLGVLAFSASGFVGGRLNGVGGPGIDDANSLGMFLATGVVSAAILVLVEQGWRRVFCIVAAPIILNGIVLAASRGAFLGLLAGGFVLFLVKPPKYARLFWSLAIVGALGAVSLMDQRFIDRMLSITDAVERTEEIDASAESRWELVAAQLRMFPEYPFGAGHKGTAVLSPRFLDARWLTHRPGEDKSAAARSSHNTFLTALVEQGIPGALIYFAFVAWGVFAVRRLRRDVRADSSREKAYGGAPAAALAVVLVAGMFTDYLMAEVQVWMLALMVAHRLSTVRAQADLSATSAARVRAAASAAQSALQPTPSLSDR